MRARGGAGGQAVQGQRHEDGDGGGHVLPLLRDQSRERGSFYQPNLPKVVMFLKFTKITFYSR
jgi:hypothetical protein